MSNVAKLKKQAAEFEQKKQFDKAVAKYIEIVQFLEGKSEDVDVALYNRVGDLLIRQNNVGDAVTYYEKAVDHYAEAGLFNNAIALCNKILRSSPGRTEVYYKLGKISAQKGFNSDAKQNFLEYADRKQKAGAIDEAFRALKEFADLCPNEDGIRLMLANQLEKAGRQDEALEQLNMLYQHLEAEGRSTEAESALERMKAIDPSYEPSSSQDGGSKKKSGGLVFLDLDEPKKAGGRSSIASRRASRALDDLPLISPEPAAPPPKAAAKAPPAAPPAPEPVQAIEGLETTMGFEPTAITTPPEPELELPTDFSDLAPLPTMSEETPAETKSFRASLQMSTSDLQMLDEDDATATPAEGVEQTSGGGDLDLIMPDDAATSSHRKSGAMLSDMEPPMLQDDLSSSMMDVSGLGIDLDSQVPSSGMNTPSSGIGAISMDDPFAFPSIELEHGGGSDADPATAAAPIEELDLVEEEPPAPQAPAAHRASSTSTLALSADALHEKVMANESDWALRRQYAEALLDGGDREGGLRELEAAMLGYERTDDLESAGSVADEIIRLDPNSVRHHQKRVEYAFRTNDKPRLVEAYLQLADSLFKSGQEEKSRAVYQRVLDLAPDDIRAQAALTAFPEEEAAAPPKKEAKKEKPGAPAPASKRYTAEMKRASVPVEKKEETAERPDDAFVNLGDWLRDDAPKDTRMIVEEKEPTGDEQADFADMLKKFKQGVADNVEDEDHESHYDLGVAYKEMGLLDEAIGEFQKALRGTGNRVRAYEALGNCFIEKGQHQVAATVLSRALAEKGIGDEKLVGVLYLLGFASETLGKFPEALDFYNRVFSVDVQFRDVGDRINAVEQVAR